MVTPDLLKSVAQVDVLDMAGRIIANPERARVPLAAQIALAVAVERMWSVCLEADGLVAALDRAADAPAEERSELAGRLIGHAVEIERRMAAFEQQPETQQKEARHGSGHS